MRRSEASCWSEVSCGLILIISWFDFEALRKLKIFSSSLTAVTTRFLNPGKTNLSSSRIFCNFPRKSDTGTSAAITSFSLFSFLTIGVGKTNELPNLYATIISNLGLFRSLVSIKLISKVGVKSWWMEERGEKSGKESTIFVCLVTRENWVQNYWSQPPRLFSIRCPQKNNLHERKQVGKLMFLVHTWKSHFCPVLCS